MPSIQHRAIIRQRAFSLVEVVISLGIIAFAFIGITALLPLGLKSNRDSMEESRAMNLLQTMIADWQASAWTTNSIVYNLPSLAGITTVTTATLFIAEDGTTNSSPANSFYRVSYTIYPNTNYMQPACVDFLASWPAMDTNAQSHVEVLSTFLP